MIPLPSIAYDQMCLFFGKEFVEIFYVRISEVRYR